MWLYRARILNVIAGLSTEPVARRFVLMIVAAFLPALLAGAFLAGFVKSVLYERLAVVAVSFVLGGIVILIVERTRPAPQIREADQTPLAQAVGIGLFQTLAGIQHLLIFLLARQAFQLPCQLFSLFLDVLLLRLAATLRCSRNTSLLPPPLV